MSLPFLTKLAYIEYLLTNSQWRQAKAWRDHWQRL